MKMFQVLLNGFSSLGIGPTLKQLNHKSLKTIAKASTSIISLWVYLLREADSPQKLMESIYFVMAGSGVGLTAINTFCLRNEIFSLLGRIDAHANERLKSSTSKKCYEDSNRLVEKYSQIGFFVLEKVIAPCFIVPKATVSFFIYFTTDSGKDAFALPCPLWFPFDWRNPIGYGVAVAASLQWAALTFQYMSCLIFFTFGLFMYVNSFVSDLKGELYSINKMAKTKMIRKNAYRKLSDFIRLHAELKDVVRLFEDVFDIILIIIFVGCIVCMCVPLLMIQIQISQLHNNIESTILLEACLAGVWAFIVLVYVCELGQRFSNSIEKIGKMIDQLNWYLYPKEIQRLLPAVIQSAQEPAVIKCFGNILCARKQFRKVVKTVYSYFMILRKFYK